MSESSPPPRKWLVRRRLKPRDEEPASPKTKVLIARRIRPGQTLTLESGRTVTMADDEKLVESVPETLVLQPSSSRSKHDGEQFGDAKSQVPESQVNLYRRHLDDIAEAKRIEAVQQRERLNTLLCGEMLLATREGRILERWEKMNQVWDRTRRRLSKRVGISMERLSMDQGNEYREKIEALHLLNTATPLENKMTSPAAWKMSLRGETSTFVPIGNIFSGLFCEVKSAPPGMIETIRKPTRGREFKGRNPGSGWRKSSVYQQRFHQLRNRIAVVRPHEIVQTDSLEIVGQDLFDLRRRLPDYSTEPESLRAKSKEDLALVEASPVKEVNQEDKTMPLIVRLETSASTLTFNVSPAQTDAISRVIFTNSGTTAVHFRFRPLPRPEPLSHISHTDHGFSWLDVEFTILPGQTLPVTFRFTPRRPGLSILSLSLAMFPKPSDSEALPELHLKGVKHVTRRNIDESIRSFTDKLDAEVAQASMRFLAVEIAENAVRARLKLQANMRAFMIDFVGGRVWSTCQLRAEMRSYLKSLIDNRVWPKCELRSQMRTYIMDLVERHIPYADGQQQDNKTDKI